MTTTSLAARTAPAALPTAPSTLPLRELPRLRDLRERRLELRAEQVRSRYLSRLLQARLDLSVAATVQAHAHERSTGWPEDLPVPPTADEVGELLRQPGGDLADHLASLQDALSRMASYEEALDRECDASTEQLVHALTRSPRAGLDQAPGLPGQRRPSTDRSAG